MADYQRKEHHRAPRLAEAPNQRGDHWKSHERLDHPHSRRLAGVSTHDLSIFRPTPNLGESTFASQAES